MITLNELNHEIDMLEQARPTYDICQKLASLYIIKQHIVESQDSKPEQINPQVINNQAIKQNVVEEYSDILPEYNKYVKVKTRYQLGEVTSDMVVKSLVTVCDEIKEFIETLYSSTDTQAERSAIADMITAISNKVL